MWFTEAPWAKAPRSSPSAWSWITTAHEGSSALITTSTSSSSMECAMLLRQCSLSAKISRMEISTSPSTTKTTSATYDVSSLHSREIVDGNLKCNSLFVGMVHKGQDLLLWIQLHRSESVELSTKVQTDALQRKTLECMDGIFEDTKNTLFKSDVCSLGMRMWRKRHAKKRNLESLVLVYLMCAHTGVLLLWRCNWGCGGRRRGRSEARPASSAAVHCAADWRVPSHRVGFAANRSPTTGVLKVAMETRLQLRRRLLRIEDSSKANSSASPEVLTALKNATSELRLKAFARKQQSNAADDAESDECEDGEDADEDDEGGEEDECVEEDELDTAAASGALNGNSGSTNDTPPPPPKRMDKCETSSVVKLLFSRHDSARSPTICFDYPPHLRTTREYTYQIPSCSSHTSSTSSSGGGSAQVGQHRVVVLNVQDCPLFYKTHWERNCVKNAFAVAGIMRTKKKWTGWHIAWAKHIPKTKFKFFKNNVQHAQVFNHFPDPWVIGRKDRLMRTLASYKRRFGSSYSFVPEGFTLPDQMDAFRRAIQREDNDGSGTTSSSSGSGSTGSIWILKPPASACGRGIRVITSKDVESISKERKYVVQKYVANPLLLDGFKFDLRIYVVVTSVDPLRIYLFNEGIARFCTSEYSLEKLKNRFSHLTNYSVNKTNDRFVENTDDNSTADGQGNAGSKWSLTGLLAHLQSRQLLKDPEQLKQQIRDIICKTIIAAEAHLTPLVHQFVKKPVTCYELFGFDVMLDSNLKPWLIEVNVSPSLMGGSPLDKRVKGLLLSDIFHLVGVPVSIDSLPAGMLPKDLERNSDSQSSLSSSSSASTALSKASVPLFSRRRSLGLHTTTAGFRRTSTTPSSLAFSSSSSSRAAVNKQLHEFVLDPSVARFENNHLELFTSSDWDMVHAMEDEMDRLGHFERIFPSSVCPEETSKYAPFFTCQRYSNALCAKWISSQLSRSSSGSKARKPSKPKLHQPNQTAKR